MNPTTKNLVLAATVSLVVAAATMFGAKAFSSLDSSTVSAAVMAPDGSVIGRTEPIRAASSGPPVPACNTLNTVLTCPGAALPFTWNFPVGGGDSGIANEAFGNLIYVNTDAGFTIIGKATITPSQTGEMAITSSVEIPFGDAGCPFDSGVSTNNGVVVMYTVHNAAADTGVPIVGNFLDCLNLSPLPQGNVVTVTASGAVSGLANDGGTSYDFLLMGGGGGGVTVPDSSVGGIWVHEVP